MDTARRETEEKNPAELIRTYIEKSVLSPNNNLGTGEQEPAWDTPLVGFSRGDDPLYLEFKGRIGPFYWTPLEIFAETFPSVRATAEELTVISWILPQTEATKHDHRRQTTHPSERWARSRKYGEIFNEWLRDQVIALLRDAGYEAVAPSSSPHFGLHDSERYGLSTTWSERHAAYASGLGTFGLCDGLITPVGKAIRCGSIVARISLKPSERTYKDPHEHCLFFAKNMCGACIKRCPAGAISEKGHDKEKCIDYMSSVTAPYVSSYFGFDSYGCGFCQTGVPCESRIP